MVTPIVQTVADGILIGLKLFSEERRRSLSKKYLELLTARDEARRAVYPDYSGIEVYENELALANFIKAYNSEFSDIVDVIVGAKNV